MTLWMINFLAISFLAFLALVVLRYALRGAITKKHVFEAARVISIMLAVALAIPASRGEIGQWAFWLGGAMVISTAVTVFL